MEDEACPGSPHDVPVRTALPFIVALGLVSAGDAAAQQKRPVVVKTAAETSSAEAAVTGTTAGRRPATQKLMRFPWEKGPLRKESVAERR